jgi:hypothetical protein
VEAEGRVFSSKAPMPNYAVAKDKVALAVVQDYLKTVGLKYTAEVLAAEAAVELVSEVVVEVLLKSFCRSHRALCLATTNCRPR